MCILDPYITVKKNMIPFLRFWNKKIKSLMLSSSLQYGIKEANKIFEGAGNWDKGHDGLTFMLFLSHGTNTLGRLIFTDSYMLYFFANDCINIICLVSVDNCFIQF